MTTRSPYSMLSVEDALNVTLTQARPPAPEQRPLSKVRGAILAADIAAQEPLPPFPASTKDGYAVVAADGPGDYPMVGEVSAGALADFAVEPGTVAYITTGAPVARGGRRGRHDRRDGAAGDVRRPAPSSHQTAGAVGRRRASGRR